MLLHTIITTHILISLSFLLSSAFDGPTSFITLITSYGGFGTLLLLFRPFVILRTAYFTVGALAPLMVWRKSGLTGRLFIFYFEQRIVGGRVWIQKGSDRDG